MAEEWLKSLKSIHHALILSSAIILIFAISSSPDPSRAELAIEELADFGSIIADRHKEERVWLNEYYRDTTFGKTLKDAFRYSDLQISPEISFSHEYFYYNLQDMRVKDYETYLRNISENHIGIIVFDLSQDQIDRVTADLLELFTESSHSGKVEELIFANEDTNAGYQAVRFHLKISTDEGPQTIKTRRTWTLLASPIERRFPDNVDTIEGLYEKVPGGYAVFPQLRSFWSLLNEGEMDVDSAKSTLEREIPEDTNDIKIIGIAFPQSFAGIGFPIALLFIQLYFLLYIRSFSGKNRDSSAVPEYPWIGQFRDCWSRMIFGSTLTFLPAISISILLLNIYGNDSLTVACIVPVGLSSLLLGGGSVWYAIIAFR